MYAFLFELLKLIIIVRNIIQQAIYHVSLITSFCVKEKTDLYGA